MAMVFVNYLTIVYLYFESSRDDRKTFTGNSSAGWAEKASRLKYRPVIAGYFHLKKRNFGRILMVKINKVDRSFRRDRIDPK